MKTSEIVRALRISQGLSQDELAKRVGYKTRSSISKFESGASDPSQAALQKLARALGVSPGVLVGDSDDQFSIERSILRSLVDNAPADKIHKLLQLSQVVLEDDQPVSAPVPPSDRR